LGFGVLFFTSTEAGRLASGVSQPSVSPMLHINACNCSRDGYHRCLLVLTLTCGPFDPCPYLSGPLIESSPNPQFRGIANVSMKIDPCMLRCQVGRPGRGRVAWVLPNFVYFWRVISYKHNSSKSCGTY